ncbi:MAG: hypothetical protein WC796_02240 [Candidatus Pacearchaeota archaeon]
MNREDVMTVSPEEAIAIIRGDDLMTTLLRVSDVGHRTLCTVESAKGDFLGVFGGEVYRDRHVEVVHYSDHGMDSDEGYWVYDKDRDLVVFHAKELDLAPKTVFDETRKRHVFRPTIIPQPAKNRFTWESGIDSEHTNTFIGDRSKPLYFDMPVIWYELLAFQPGDWQQHIKLIEREVGYVKDGEDFLGPREINKRFDANCFVHA